MFAVAEFGSTSRDSADKHSDRDLLVVCEASSRHRLYQRYSAEGFSVSALTPTQLKHMQRRGSLFVQHLKREARILIDVDSELKIWLGQCALVQPSDSELERCKATIEFIAAWPDDMRLTGWQADFLYCVSRDLLIKWLATKGVLAFGLEDLEPALRGVRQDGFGCLDNLSVLRRAKAAYRTSKPIPAGTSLAIRSWLAELAPAFSMDLPTVSADRPETLLASLQNKSFSSSYELLRSLEVAYVIARSHGLLHPQHADLMKHITSPNAYGSTQMRKSKVIEQFLSDILSLLDDKALHPLADGVHGLSSRESKHHM